MVGAIQVSVEERPPMMDESVDRSEARARWAGDPSSRFDCSLPGECADDGSRDMTAQEALDRSICEIREKIEQHAQLLGHLGTGDRRIPACSLVGCRHSRCLRKVLLEAVEVLENSRKAFKSKELEALRKKIIGVLADDT